MKKLIKVEVRGAPNSANGVHYFGADEKELAQSFAFSATAWFGGQYRITTVFVEEESK